MDRFAMRFELGYVTQDQEVDILTEQNISHPLDMINACTSRDVIINMRHEISQVRVSDEIKNYIVNIIRETRNAKGVANGASPRASLSLMKAAQSLALFDGLQYVTPDHIHELVQPVITHRLMLDSQARFSGLTAKDVVADIIKNLPVPA
jgi:MoxR-like ATPase